MSVSDLTAVRMLLEKSTFSTLSLYFKEKSEKHKHIVFSKCLVRHDVVRVLCRSVC